MEKNDYLIWLKKWFTENLGVSQDDLSSNFFSAGLLDSFKTLELILEIENAHNIILTDSAFSDARFHNLIGLAEILFEAQQAQSTTVV